MTHSNKSRGPLKALKVENRGTDDVPYGYVYLGFHQGEPVTRVGFGADRDNRDPLAVWPCSETPFNLHQSAYLAARELLEKAFPHFATLTRGQSPSVKAKTTQLGMTAP